MRKPLRNQDELPGIVRPMIRMFLLVLFTTNPVWADYTLGRLPLLSTITFSRNIRLEPINGYANLGNIGCYLGSRVRNPNLSTKGRSLKVISVERVYGHAPLSSYVQGYKFEFLEGGWLSSLHMVCHYDVKFSELAQELKESAEIFEAPQQPPYGYQERRVEDYPSGTLLRLQQDFQMEASSKGTLAGLLFSIRGGGGDLSECVVRTENANLTLLKKGQTFRMTTKPYYHTQKGYMTRILVGLVDIRTGDVLQMTCYGKTDQLQFQVWAKLDAIQAIAD